MDHIIEDLTSKNS